MFYAPCKVLLKQIVQVKGMWLENVILHYGEDCFEANLRASPWFGIVIRWVSLFGALKCKVINSSQTLLLKVGPC